MRWIVQVPRRRRPVSCKMHPNESSWKRAHWLTGTFWDPDFNPRFAIFLLIFFKEICAEKRWRTMVDTLLYNLSLPMRIMLITILLYAGSGGWAVQSSIKGIHHYLESKTWIFHQINIQEQDVQIIPQGQEKEIHTLYKNLFCFLNFADRPFYF